VKTTSNQLENDHLPKVADIHAPASPARSNPITSVSENHGVSQLGGNGSPERLPTATPNEVSEQYSIIEQQDHTDNLESENAATTVVMNRTRCVEESLFAS